MLYSNEHINFLKKKKKKKFLIAITQILIFITFIIIWELLAKYKIINTFLTSSPSLIFKTIINLAKNPTGANVSLRILNEDDDEKELLFVLNDNMADGFDVSWIWDINFDNLNNVSRIITSGQRAYDIAIRIKTSGFDANKIEPYLDLDEAVKSKGYEIMAG